MPVSKIIGAYKPSETVRAHLLYDQLLRMRLRGFAIQGTPWLDRRSARRMYWRVKAICIECGEPSELYTDNLRNGKTTGCRCSRAYKHGGTKGARYENIGARRLGERYDAILQRCRNPSHRQYKDYGGRGIELRFESRSTFIRWCQANLPHPTYLRLQIDRTNNDGHYEPGNLRLVPAAVNLRNTSRNNHITYRGARVVGSDLWHLLKTDFPRVTVGPHRVAKLVAQGLDWRSIAAVVGRPRATSPEYEPDPAVLALYELGPLERLSVAQL